MSDAPDDDWEANLVVDDADDETLCFVCNCSDTDVGGKPLTGAPLGLACDELSLACKGAPWA